MPNEQEKINRLLDEVRRLNTVKGDIELKIKQISREQEDKAEQILKLRNEISVLSVQVKLGRLELSGVRSEIVLALDELKTVKESIDSKKIELDQKIEFCNESAKRAAEAQV